MGAFGNTFGEMGGGQRDFFVDPSSYSDLSFWVKSGTRNGLILPDTVNIGTNDVTILTPSFYPYSNSFAVTGSKTRSSEKVFDGNSYTIYFKLNQLEDVATSGGDSSGELNLLGGSAGAYRGICWYFNNGSLNMNICDGTTRRVVTQISNINTNLRNAGFVEFFIEVDFDTKKVRSKVYNSSGVIIGTSINQDISDFVFNGNDNIISYTFSNNRFAHYNFKKYSGLKTLAQCRLDNYVTDLQIWLPTIIDGTDVSGNGNHFVPHANMDATSKYYSNNYSYCLDYGYTLYRNTLGTQEDIYVPYTILGNSITRTFTGYTAIEEHAGSLTNHNLYDSYLVFVGSNWDRSNTTIYSTSARGSFYDVASPKKWHILELNTIIMNGYFNTNYKGLCFSKVDNNSYSSRNILKELFGYTINKSGNMLNNILRYTNDYITPKVYDKGQLAITFDDSTKSQYTVAFPILKTKNAKATFYSQTGAIIPTTTTFKTPIQFKDMYSYGMDMQCHTHTHVNLTTLDQSQTTAELTNVNNFFTANGASIPYHIAYPGGAFDNNVKTYVNGLRLTGRAVGQISDSNYINSNIDKYALTSNACDNLSDNDLISLKSKMYYCRTNNKALIIYTHGVSTNGSSYEISTAKFTEIIDYAQSIGIDIVTISDLYNHILEH